MSYGPAQIRAVRGPGGPGDGLAGVGIQPALDGFPAGPGPMDHPVTVSGPVGEAAFSCPPGQTVLFAGQAAGWDLPYECASGLCGTCRAQLLTGEVISLWPEASGLTERDRRRGNRVLLCQARSATGGTFRSLAELRRLADATPRPARHQCVITGMDRLTPEMMELRVETAQPVPYLPGQFVILEMPDGTRRPYSMSRRSGLPLGRLEMLIRNKPGGAASRWLFAGLGVGGRLTTEGPYGRAHAQSPPRRPVVCVAGGSGLGQVLAIAEQCLAADANRPLTLYYGGRSAADLVLAERISGLRDRGAAVIAVTETAGPAADPLWGPVRTGLVTDAVTADHDDLTDHDIYLAGPDGMIRAALAQLVRTNRAAADRVFFDRSWT
jgi:NAD(P)H-flavin reductase/ferredoxin